MNTAKRAIIAAAKGLKAIFHAYIWRPKPVETPLRVFRCGTFTVPDSMIDWDKMYKEGSLTTDEKLNTAHKESP